jgi:hypothetical protein
VVSLRAYEDTCLVLGVLRGDGDSEYWTLCEADGSRKLECMGV